MSDVLKLRSELSALAAQLRKAEEQERDAVNASLVGRAFKYRNCYSCPTDESDYWNLYSLVLGVDAGCLRVLRFERDKHGKLEVEVDATSGSTLGDEISMDEFNAARAEFQAAVSELLATSP